MLPFLKVELIEFVRENEVSRADGGWGVGSARCGDTTSASGTQGGQNQDAA